MSKYTQEDLDRILDKLHEGPIGHKKEWQWDSATRIQMVQASITSESRKKQGESMKRWHSSASKHKKKLSKLFSGQNNPAKRAEVIKKRNDTFRSIGRLFIELNSNSFGYVSDMSSEFGINKSQVIFLATHENVPKRGKAVGLTIRFYNEDIHPPISQLIDIRQVKE